ncbi:mucin-binding protein [Secundilactobacillus yichangensis]|uniref:mucin-binding protein n=1 Tax=Secundilactobacillus yichangensis TaxID=2799580 RepID=UPI001940A6ED|nr:KxYKxGKxW signal peptide domain-containing protein [Secundilactobacillus yichangensis]
MSKNNLRSPFIENKHHVKLYKRGKTWVAMGITMAILAGISFATSTTASAADGTTTDPASSMSQTNSTEQTVTSTDSQNDTTASAPANTGNESTDTPDTDQGAAAQAQPKSTAAADSTTPSTTQAAEAPTQAVGPTVSTVDKSGSASTDPANTGSSNDTPTVVTGEDVAKNFVAGGSNGTTTPKINGDTVDLTNPTDSTYVKNGVVVAKDAVDFTSDFNLDATVNVKWDSTMGGWLGGDGMAVAFQPVSIDDAMTKGGYGSGMGLVRNTDGTISYIISTDAIKQSPATNDGQPFDQVKNWVIYQSGSNSNQATGGVYDTGVALPQGASTGSLSYSFDVTYKADTKQLSTNIVDSNNQVVKTYTQTIADDQIGKNYLLGVTAATAFSKAAYSVTINKYSYVPADAKLNITSNMPNVAQSNINGTPGQVIAFYQEGTAKPTADSKGNAVSVAYTVPKVDGYSLSPQFVTLTAGGENTVAINYAGNQISNATVTIPTNKGEQTVSNVSGRVGDTVHISVPSLQGYTADKTMVDATVNADGTITVVTPKAETGDAGYVTYTADTQTVIMHIGDNTWTTTGASDTPINYDQQAILALVPKGYTINANTPKDVFETILKQSHVPTTFDNDTTKDQIFTLNLQPAEDFNHATTTRTIHFVDGTGKTVSPDVVQTVNWVEAVNAATGEPIGFYSPIDWYTSLTAPTVDGYTPDTSSITENHPISTDNPENAKDVTVTYTADTQTMVVHVGDKTWTTTGPSDSAINYDQQAILALFPAGYTMGSQTTKEAFDAILQRLEAPTAFDHDTANNQSITLPFSKAEDFSHTTTTRTIHFVDSNGKTLSPDVVQTVNWVRAGEATPGSEPGVYSPIDWYTSVNAPTIAGYTPDMTSIAEEHPMITENPENAKDITVTYTGETQKMIVTVGDKTWITTGESGSDITYDTKAILDLIPDGYSITASTSSTTLADWLAKAPKQFDTDTAKDQNLTLPISPAESFNHTTTTRTIHFVDGNGNTIAPDVVQTVNWVQPVNAATGKPTDVYTPMDWYTAVTAPTVTGYTPNKASVAADHPMITDAPTNAKDITIVYTGNQITADVTIPSNQGPQTATNVTGQVGETVSVPVPPINGYTADKSTVTATVNPDGTITVNAPKDKPGDAGYVTYTANSNGGSTGQPGGDNGNPGNTDNTPQTGNETSPTDETTQPGTVPNQTTPTTDNGTATTQDGTATKPANQGVSESTGHSTGTANMSTAAAGQATPATNQQSATQLSHSVAATGETATGQQKNQSAAGQLPQTNEQSDQAKTAGVLGLMMLSLLSLFGLKRKETDGK